jgi:hypothetical protein
MKAINIYVEGAGVGANSNHGKREPRQGFDALLNKQKQAARAKKVGWTLSLCGSRNEAFNAFKQECLREDAETLVVLLVDSEDAIAPEGKNTEDAKAQARVQHLSKRDGWDLSDANPNQVHLMVRCMEAWIVADPNALVDYYGKNFHARSLPNRRNLEDEPKPDLYDKLKKATEKTQKGAYAKIKHASKLLERIDPAKVAKRCSRFMTFTIWLTDQINGA